MDIYRNYSKVPGYFNNRTRNNHRPPHIKAYANAVRRLGKEEADKKFPGILNWVTSQRLQGLNSRTSYTKKRKTRKSRR